MLSKYTKSCIAAGIAFASASAHAQSSVTLYGIVDNGVDFVSNAAGSKSYQQRAANLSTSRFGFRGKEDLGDGWSAIFWLENGFNAANGVFQPNDMFGRQASVGLSSNRYGTITMGRQYDFVISYLATLSTVVQGWGGHLASHPLNNDNLENTMRFRSSASGTASMTKSTFAASFRRSAIRRRWRADSAAASGSLPFSIARDQEDSIEGRTERCAFGSASNTQVS